MNPESKPSRVPEHILRRLRGYDPNRPFAEELTLTPEEIEEAKLALTEVAAEMDAEMNTDEAEERARQETPVGHDEAPKS